jgi:hypothetical protein
LVGPRRALQPRSAEDFWGYGPELADPDGYVIRLWDEKSMREK